MVTERTEADAFRSTITGTLGGLPISVPVLRIRFANDWRLLLQERAGVVGKELYEGLDGIVALTSEITGAVLDLVAAYDRDGVLGGRQHIEDTAYDGEVWVLFRQMVDASYPFVDDFNRMVMLTKLVTSQPSTSESSPNGDSRPSRSKASSRTSN